MDRALFGTAFAFPASLYCFTDLILHNRFLQAPQQGLCVVEEKAHILGTQLIRRTAKSTDIAPLGFSIVKGRLDKNAYIHGGSRLVPKPCPTTSTTRFCPLPLGHDPDPYCCHATGKEVQPEGQISQAGLGTDRWGDLAFRRHTLLPLYDCLYALQSSIPHLTRSALHRCLQRHGISRLPDVEGDKPKRSKFKRYPIGFFHIDIAEVQTAEGKLFLFVGIDRTSKFAVTQLVEKADRKTAWEFLQYMLEAVPYQVHTILTDNGIQFAEQPRNRNTAYSRPMRFDMICEANGIEHRLTKPNHPWTNGQVERMNRTIKEATVKRYHYDSHDQLRTHLTDFMAAYNFARRLKTLNGLTPYEYICKIWTSEPDRFILNPIHQMPGLNT